MERPKALVVDASIVVKWYVPEADSPDALIVRAAQANEQVTLFAPDLLIYELANALRFRSGLTDNDLRNGIHSLFDLNLGLIAPTANSVSQAALLARTLDLTIYDATYLALAQELDCQLVTSDVPFHDKVTKASEITKSSIILLKDFSRKGSSSLVK